LALLGRGLGLMGWAFVGCSDEYISKNPSGAGKIDRSELETTLTRVRTHDE